VNTRIALLLLLASVSAGIYLYSQSPPPGRITSTPGESYLIILGTQDKAPTLWAGGIKITGSTLLDLSVWRRGKGDSVNVAKSSFVVNTRKLTGVSGNTSLPENGIVVTVAPQTTDIMFGVGITHKAGTPVDCTVPSPTCFSFHSSDLPFGAGKYFLNGNVYVARTTPALQLTSSLEEEDFPSIARSGDDVWISYVRFVHGDRTLQQPTGFKQPLPQWVQDQNFGLLARPAGGDQVFTMHYSVSGRTWTGPYPITAAGEDVMRTAVAIDGQKRAWVFYSTQRSNNFDLYARRIDPAGTVSSEVRLTTLPGTDLNPVATTDSTGRVWVAWQAFRATNLQILAAVQPTPSSNTMSAERLVSTSPANNWDPAIAAGANGEITISWDTYDKGDYDVYVRKATANTTGVISMPAVQPVAASLGFEARSSIAYDPQNRLWIAYETADRKWGKDFATLETSGVNLYQNHNIAVRCLDGTAQYATTADLTKALPGPPPARLFQTTRPAAKGILPDPALASSRPEDQALTSESNYPVLPNNSMPRLAIDSEGTVYLAFRTKAGGALSSDSPTGASVGSIWIEQMLYFDGVNWSAPGVIAQSDGLLDNRPAMVALDPGHVLIAQSMDHRLSPAPGSTLQNDTVNSDIYAAELTVERKQQAVQLTQSPAVIDAQSAEEKAEAAQAALMTAATVQIGTQTYQVRRGDFHRHTEFSFDGGGDGSLPDAYRYMIDAGPLQWGGCCDHDNGGSREYSWWILQKYTEAYFMGGRYTPVFNYERSVGYPDGHRNAVFARRGVRPLPRIPMTNPPTFPSPDTQLFYAYLKNFGGLDAAHSTATDQGTNWNANDPAVETTVEIYQGARQSYEMAESPRANASCDSIDTFKPDGFVSAALAKGYVLGFESSSDHRATHTSYANVWTTDTTRQGIIDALAKRRVYASTDLILADVRIGDHFMGEDFTITGAPTLSVTLKGTAPFSEVVIVKDGNIVFTTSGPSSLSFTFQDKAAFQKGQRSYYYVRGLQQGPDLPTYSCESYKRTQGAVVWTSPMWVTMQ
jgi:hypothetical protein